MKFLITATLILLLSFGAKADNIFVLPRSINAIFFFSNQGVGPVSELWTTVDAIALGIPADATAVYLQGLMAITGGAAPDQCTMYFLATPNKTYDWANQIGLNAPSTPGLIFPGFGIGEAYAPPHSSTRQTFASWVPLVGGKFFYIWTRSTYGEWPDNCSYGANLVIQGYTK